MSGGSRGRGCAGILDAAQSNLWYANQLPDQGASGFETIKWTDLGHGESRGSCQGKKAAREATDLPRPPPSSEYPTASALPVSLLVAWIVAQLRRRNFKRLQGQNCQSIKSEKLAEGVEGRSRAGEGGGGENTTQGNSSHLHLRKRPAFSRPPGSRGRWEETLGH